jgi:hypothetical protein
MSIQRTKSKSSDDIALLVNNTTSAHSVLSPSEANPVIFNVGGGFAGTENQVGFNTNPPRFGSDNSYSEIKMRGTTFGDWTLFPMRRFEADVKMWGAGGGAQSHSGDSWGGGGGYARAQITFYPETPYTIWVGQGGFHCQHRYNGNHNRWNYRTSGTFGNGGGGGQSAGSGGGMSGIFYNTLGNDGGQGAGHNSQGHGGSDTYGGVSTWFRAPSQNNALLIAGGGGGQGHSGSGHHGQGGGGGGTNGREGHNSPGGTQTGGGGSWTNGSQSGHQMHGGHAGNSNTGGGGGGWFGGAGGSHTDNHHNGGGGGSGHSLEANSVSGFRNFWIKSIYPNIVRETYMEQAPGSHGNRTNMAAGRSEGGWEHAGCGAGTGNHNSNSNSMKWLGHYNSWREGTNGRVVIKVVE